MFVCVHSTALGPGGGGTRLRVYPTPADGLADAMRLSGAMTRKFAAAGLPRGGGKAVLAVPELPTGDARRQLLLRYGELVDSLGGTYRTAGDMNITPADLDVVAERCRFVYGTTARGGNSARGTARGVLHADSRNGRERLRLAGRERAANPRTGRRLRRGRRRAAARGRGRDRPRLRRRRGARGRDGIHRRPAGRRDRHRVRRVLPVRGRRHPERGVDPAAALPRDRRLREQPARGARGRRPPARRRHPLRTRLRRERGRRHPAGRSRGRSAGTRTSSSARSPASATPSGRCSARPSPRGSRRPPPRSCSRPSASPPRGRS